MTIIVDMKGRVQDKLTSTMLLFTINLLNLQQRNIIVTSKILE